MIGIDGFRFWIYRGDDGDRRLLGGYLSSRTAAWVLCRLSTGCQSGGQRGRQQERAHTFHSHSWSPLRFCIYRCAYHTVFSAVLSTLSINKRGGSVLPMPPSPQDHLACFLSQSSSSDKSGAIWTWGKGKKSCLGVVPLRTAEKWHPARWPPPRPERCPHSIAPGRPRLPIAP